MTITVQVPDVFLEDLATSPEELDREIRRLFRLRPDRSGRHPDSFRLVRPT
jgi:hypothetical protein